LTLNLGTGDITGTPTTTGSFDVALSATNGFGTGTMTLVLTVAVLKESHITNFSARALSGVGDNSLILGFAVSGSGKSLLVRGIGPGLSFFGISDFLPTTILTIYDNNGAVTATNENWEIDAGGQNDEPAMTAAAASAGAFPLAAGSLDSAVLITVDSGDHTATLTDSNGAPGVGLIEIYDAGGNPDASLINVSARMKVTGGSGTLIAGLVIEGNTAKTVLVRAVGPTLSEFGVAGVLLDPQITVFSGTTPIADNASWGSGSNTAAQVIATSAQVGAFPLPLGSKDAALVLTLQPGAYTVQVTSLSDSSGVALVEIYDASPDGP
jgi:hypothetical protein